MTDIEIKSGDTRPPIEATLQTPNRTNSNITGADVYFVVENPRTNEIVFEKEATVVEAEEGEVKYSWDSGDTDNAGYYEGRFKVKYGADTSDPDVQHYPNDQDSITISIFE